MMSLPASQQHALDAIDDGLRHGGPRLATMFAVFARLTRQESMPARETLPPRQWRARRRWLARRPARRPGRGALAAPPGSARSLPACPVCSQ